MQEQEFDFKRDVVDLSFEKPVLIDFWADWCGPCKMLTPVLEELEKEDNGKWTLVKINTEEHQEIASYFRIQSIPNCKLVFEGKLVAEFSGAESKVQVKKWLSDQFTSLQLVETIEAQSDDFDTLISDSTEFPDLKLIDKLELFLMGNPQHEDAQVLLLKHEAFYKPESALHRLESLKDLKDSETLLADLQAIKEWMDLKTDPTNLFILAKNDLFNQKLDACLEHLIQALQSIPKFENELARRAGIALFHFLGKLHPVTKEYRKLFDMYIY